MRVKREGGRREEEGSLERKRTQEERGRTSSALISIRLNFILPEPGSAARRKWAVNVDDSTVKGILNPKYLSSGRHIVAAGKSGNLGNYSIFT